MKKILIIALLLIACFMVSGDVYATTPLGGTAGASTTFGGGVYKPSTNVTVSITSTAISYAATSCHSGAINQGTAGKEYGTQSASPQIFWALAPTSGSGPDATTTESALPSVTNGATWQ